MSGRIARREAECEHRLILILPHCAACGRLMPVAYTKTRKLMATDGLVQLHLQLRRCETSQCKR